AVAFCKWLSEKEKKKYRLPTEAEWEYVCRAGTQTRYYSGDDPKEMAKYAWILTNSGGSVQKVGQRAANAWGVHDMIGNVWEICSDYFAADYYGRSLNQNPAGPPTGTTRIIRGGAFSTEPARSAYRHGFHDSSHRSPQLGFRVVCEL